MEPKQIIEHLRRMLCNACLSDTSMDAMLAAIEYIEQNEEKQSINRPNPLFGPSEMYKQSATGAPQFSEPSVTA